jgi:hypothetical protein
MSRLHRSPLFRTISLLLAYLLTLGPSAFAFKAGIHDDVTKSMLRAKGFSDKSAVAVGDANYYTDIREPANDSAHCDNESLDTCSARLTTKLNAVVNLLNACNKKDALKEMGRGLHTLQDFYAHSNWINDNGGMYSGIYSMAHPPSSLNCSPPTFAPGGLTSGYFSLAGYLYPSPFITQCVTTPSNKCCHKDLNKDDPSRPLHTPARDAAMQSTGEFEDRLESTIRSRFDATKAGALIKLLKKDQRDIAFVIDDTGSMSEDIAGVKSTVNSLATQIAAGDEAPRFSLITFKDNVTFRGTTCELSQLQAMVAPLFAWGGGDCPEASNAAQLQAAGLVDEGGQIFLATDASARDPEIGPTLSSVVQTKNININVILTGNCVSDSGLSLPLAPSSTSTHFNAAAQSVIAPGDLTSPSSVRIFAALAALSGGMFFRVNRTEFTQAADVLLRRTRPDNADVLYAIDSTTAGKTYTVPVDSTLSDVTFVVNRLSTSSTFSLGVTRPDGSTVAPGNPDATFTTISGVSAVTINAPAAGNWTMAIGGSGRYVASAFGKSPLKLLRLRFLTPATNISPHIDVAPITGMPIAADTPIADALMTPGYTSVEFVLRNLDATVLQPLSLAVDTPDEFTGTTTAPGTSFLAYATGVDSMGQPFQRVFRKIFTGESVRVTPKVLSASGAPGATISYDFDVTNLSPAGSTFRLYFNSTRSFPVSGPSFITLAAGETKTVTLQVLIPSFVTSDDDDLLSLVVTSTSDPALSNSAVVTTLVSASNHPPDCSGAHPTIAELFSPNGKFVDVGVDGVTDPDGDPVTITITSITQDESTDELGDGATCPDGFGIGTATASLRAERSGLGDGRVYQIHFSATDGRGGACNGAVSVCVPHDQAKGSTCTDSGQTFDSTACQQ